MIINAEITTTPDCPTVRFREPKELVDLDIEIPKILNAQGWGLGTKFTVQFISHDRDKLIAVADFIVTEDTESLYTANPDGYQPMTKTVSARKAMQMSPWFYPNGFKELEVTDGEKEVKWNPGKKVHEVLINGEVVFANADKTEVMKFRDAA